MGGDEDEDEERVVSFSFYLIGKLQKGFKKMMMAG